MRSIIGIAVFMILFLIGIGFLVAGIVGTIATSKTKLGPKAPRVLSIISLVFGGVLCILPALIGAIVIAMRLLGAS